MKTDFKPILVLSSLTSLLIFSCQSYEKKADDAFDDIKQRRLLSDGYEPAAKPVEPVQVKTVHVQKALEPTPIQTFKNELEALLLSNEKKIKLLKDLPDNSSKMKKRIAGLEEKNADLRQQFIAYEQEEKVKWELFKTRVNQDAKQLENDLNELTPTKPIL